MIKGRFKRHLKKTVAFVMTMVIALSPLSEVLTGTGGIEDVKADENTTLYYYYTGGEQIFTAPCDAEYTFELYGAYGGGASRDTPYIPLSNNRAVASGNYDKTKWNKDYIDKRDWSKTAKIVNGYGGRGGYTLYKVYLTEGTKIYMNVGGQGEGYHGGSGARGGYNGGGDAYLEWVGCGGGGATSIATYSGTLKTLFETGWSGSIVAVAGGGGGVDDILYSVDINDGVSNITYYEDSEGGDGGGESGLPGYWLANKDTPLVDYENYLGQKRNYDAGETRAEAGTQTTGYKQGYGQSSGEIVDYKCDSGGGGGGYWGGYCGSAQTYVKGESNYRGDNTGGGGGSGYVNKTYSGYKSSSMTTGGNGTYGHGYIKITYKDNYTLTFCPNNGSDSYTRTVTYSTGNYNVVDGQIPSYSGYKFGGWYTESEGKGEQVYDASGNAVKGTYWTDNGSSGKWKVTSDLTVYAKWIVDTYTITLKYYKNGTLDTTKTHDVTNGSTFKISDYSSDVNYGSNYEYSKADETSWTVTGAKTVNIYYVGKKYTQTLYFYKDNVKDSTKTKTYDIAYDTTFNAYEHRGDSSFGEAYEYASIGTGSWTVTGAGSTNIYYKKKSYTETLNFYKNGTYKKSKTYTAYHGDTFDAASHANDMVGDNDFAHCHYNSIDCSSWTVPNDGTYTNVYYVWDRLKVVYKGNGNDGGSTSDSSVSYGSTVNIASNGFTKIGYSFNGWNTKSDGTGTSYSEGQTFTSNPSENEETLTLYAQWKKNKYSVSIIKGTGISSVSGVGTYEYDTQVTIDATPSTGYSWSKWTTGSTDIATKNYSFTLGAGDMSFTANATPNKYKITLNPNGGKISVNGSNTEYSATYEVTYDSGDYNDISWLSPNREGYKFNAWSTKINNVWRHIWDINGKAIKGDCWSNDDNSALWVYPNNITAYAEWIDITPPTVNVSPESTSDYATSVSVTINVSDNEAIADDSVYLYCVSTNSEVPPSNATWSSYSNNTAFSIGSGLTGTYYLWVQHAKDTTGNMSVSSPNADYHRFGPYYFDNTAPDLSNVLGTYGWYSEGVTIPFNISDGHSGIKSAILTDFNGIVLDNGDITSSRQYYFGSEGVAFYNLTVTDKVDNVAKKLFIVKIDSMNEVIPDNAVWKYLGNVTLFAHWSANRYTVHFEKNDNDSGSTRVTGTMNDVTFSYDVNETLPANCFSRTGYQFNGWNESADGTLNNGVNYPDRGVVKNITLTPGGTATLYAQWKASEYTVNFNYNKPGNATGTISGNTETKRTVKFDSSIGELPNPKLTGWNFEGWFIDGTSVKVNNDEVWRYASNKTVVAKWTAVTYEVRLHSNVPSEALGQLKRELNGSNATGWTWNGSEYYYATFTYDSYNSIPEPKNTYSLKEYNIGGWYSNELLTKYVGSGNSIWNLVAASGGVVDLYPLWRDIYVPEVHVTPTKTVNSNADNNAVKSTTITITITENGSGLSSNNVYEYGFSTSSSEFPGSWNSYCSNADPSGFTVSLPNLGSDLNGYYYLWVKCVKDNSGNISSSSEAIATVNQCHVYGVYVFDNEVPTGEVEYIENNLTLGLYDDNITNSPYAVMNILESTDNIAGISSFKLHVSDEKNSSNSTEFEFTKQNGKWTCKFNMYSSLANAQSVEKVKLEVIARDKLGNEATIPITRYDFGVLQNGAAICANDIGYKDISTTNEYVYERDNFRVEACVKSLNGTTEFKAGQKGTIQIYTFGYVDSVEVTYGMLLNYLDDRYDVSPILSKTSISKKLSYMYKHEFRIPLYCTDGEISDTRVIGYKGSSMEQRYVIYNINGSILDDVRTVIDYGAN